MIKPIFAIFLAVSAGLFSSPAAARSVAVTSGEHDGFTRIVLNFGAQVDWAFGRVLDGYRFRPLNQTADYDLSAIFNRIGKTRLASISQNPQTFELDIGFACACHAIPFEFRPGIIVIDLRDGPPPRASSFERELPDLVTPAAANIVVADPMPEGVAGGYNWLDRFKSDSPAPPAPAPSVAPSTIPDLQPLREQLLRQLSRGASDGVIDLALPKLPETLAPKAEIPAARVALGAMDKVNVQAARAPQQPIGSQGTVCIGAENLAFADWGGEGAAAAQLLTQDMAALLGEFDLPNPETVARAVQARLYLGFGQEARQLLEAFPTDSQAQPIWRGLSFLLDGDVDPNSPFMGMAACDTPAALWAVLADSSLTSTTQVNANAVILAFNRLPPHLRKWVGPRLMDRFLALKDETTASILRDAIVRASGQMPAELPISEARLDLAKGDPKAAEAHLDDAAMGANIPAATALITRVEARISQDLPIDAQTVASLSALQSELAQTPIGPDIRRALIHAEAASGNFETAFAKLAAMPDEAPVVWRALANLAEDSDLLVFAVPAPSPAPTGLAPATISTLARRLLDLGLPEPALAWQNAQPFGDKVLLAQTYLALRNAPAALAALQGQSGPEALQLASEAHRILGDHAQSAQLLAQLQQDQSRLAALARAKDWKSLAQGPQSIWSQVAEKLEPAPAPQAEGLGLLAAGQAVAASSATTRQEIEALLSQTLPR